MALLSVRNVSKRFSLKGISLRSVLSRLVGTREEPFWALRDVSFEVGPGETFGIVGANGAGKSTLLKILAGVMPPTEGNIKACERIAPLIEVGAGFHPELSGRENIYLNGSILGMKQKEIRARFESIVQFSGLEKFLDLAVKHYSSGMYMRLGFSVAVHLEPQLLLVDEVLAVGDQAFQHACYKRIREMQAAGVAIVLVSHNLSMIDSLCQRALFIECGRPALLGTSRDVLAQYESSLRAAEDAARDGTAAAAVAQVIPARIVSIAFEGDQEDATIFESGQTIRIQIRVTSTQRVVSPGWSVGITRADGLAAAASNSRVEANRMPDINGDQTLELTLPHLRLVPGHYHVDVAVSDGEMAEEWDRRRLHFEVTHPMPGLDNRYYGSVLLDHQWRVLSDSQPSP